MRCAGSRMQWFLLVGALGVLLGLIVFPQVQKVALVFELWSSRGNWVPATSFVLAFFFCCLFLWSTQLTIESAWDLEQRRIEQETSSKEREKSEAQTRENQLRDARAQAAERRQESFAAEQRAQGNRVEVLELEVGRLITLVSGTSQYGDSVRAETVTAYHSNPDGLPVPFAVFHFFKDTAFWRFDDWIAFEDANGNAFDFAGYIGNAAFVDHLREYEIVVGIGLASNTQNQVPRIADRRAATLCGILYAHTLGQRQPRILGLSIGQRTSGTLDTRRAPQRMQRVAAIVGVKVQRLDGTERELLEQIAKHVEIDGVSLSQYKGIAGESEPSWVETAECRPMAR